LQSIDILANVIEVLADKALPVLPSEPVICNKPWQKILFCDGVKPIIGYAKPQKWRKSYKQGRPIIEVLPK